MARLNDSEKSVLLLGIATLIAAAREARQESSPTKHPEEAAARAIEIAQHLMKKAEDVAAAVEQAQEESGG